MPRSKRDKMRRYHVDIPSRLWNVRDPYDADYAPPVPYTVRVGTVMSQDYCNTKSSRSDLHLPSCPTYGHIAPPF